MKDVILGAVDALIPVGAALLVLAFPQWLTKRDLKAEENQKLAQRLKLIGWLLLAAGVLILIANIGTNWPKQ